MSSFEISGSIKGPPLFAEFTGERGKITRANLTLDPSSRNFNWRLVSKDKMTLDVLAPLLQQWIGDYCARREPTVALPVDLDCLPPYTQRLLKVLIGIPFGTTISYGELAKLAGNRSAARATGAACGRNPCLLIVPCHRVVSGDGTLGGFSAGLNLKSLLLEFEGKGPSNPGKNQG